MEIYLVKVAYTREKQTVRELGEIQMDFGG